MGFYYLKKYIPPYFDDPDLIKRAIDNFNKWVDGNRINRKHDNPQWVKIHCWFDHYKLGFVKEPPGNDHAELYRDKDGNRFYVYQPYPYVKNDNFKTWDDEMVMTWAKKRGLYAEIVSPEKSWYYPGKTWLIIMGVDEEKKFIEYVQSHKFKNKRWGGVWDVY